jgi:hypothetical protein
VVLPLRGSLRFPVFALGSEGDTLSSVPMTWTVSDTSIIGFDTTSQTISGRSVGSARLSLQVEGFKPSTWLVSVIPPGVALDRDRLGLSKGSHQTIAANMVDASGKSVAPLTRGDWRSSDPGAATVGPTGQVEAKNFGRTLISVVGPAGRTDTAVVFVVGDLLVTSARGDKPSAIYQVSLGQPDSLVPLLADTVSYLGAAYSPDRTQIAFGALRGKSVALYVTEADGKGSPRVLLRLPGSMSSLAWMPDGRRIVFAVGNKDRATMGMLDLNSTTWDTLGTVNGDPSPDVAPDGSIAYIGGDKKHPDVYLIKPGSKTATRVTNTPAKKSSPRWLADGDLLFVAEDSREAEHFKVVRYSPETGNQASLLKSKAPILSLTVSPDGNTIAYLVKGASKKTPVSVLVRGLDAASLPRQLGVRPDDRVTALSF